MSDGLKISEHIYSHTLFGDKCEFSGLGALTEFFSSVPQAVQERWPFDLSDKGYRTFYEQALIVSEQLGFVSRLHLRARITRGEETYAVSRKICFEDDKMVFVHDSLRREKGAAGANFAHLLMARTRDFLQAYDQTRKICYKNEHSEIFVQARSAPKGKIPVYGGYIWANQGFDFRDKSDLPRFRDRFRSFLSAHGVKITDKDLKRFTRPCHFAAFGCGIQVADDNGHGVHLGKAFMLEQTWFGRWSTENPRAEEKRYAEAYNREGIPHASRRRQAVAVLNENYKNILRKFYKQYAPKRRILPRIKVYQRLAQRQWHHLVGGGRN